ncbi:hypothetical protein MMA231_02472 [Asticcacaulis sp. MM231]|uniref:phage major capsid protein, P2 family n=1 Tax=Asticcacaulis sp. MM231 TaxID=3157666 RepID=UPI0032D5AE0E
MRNETRIAFMQFTSHIALLNGVPDASVKFVAAPSIQQKLVDKVQLSSDFLSKINMPLVIEKSAEIIGLGISGPIASRTNTTTTDRAPADPSSLDNRPYDCKQTNFDTQITYAKLDMWAKFPDFQIRIQNLIVKRIALDMIMVGFNGVQAAATTDKATYPLGQDVNIGWLQKARTECPAQVLSDGADTTAGFTTKVTYGTAATADYKTLDALVYDALRLMPEHARKDPDLVVLVSDDLLDDKYFPLINQIQDAENQLATDIIMSTKRLGGKPAAIVPYFPSGTIMITKYSNLSIYEQEGAHRRNIVDNSKRDRIEDYQSGNYAYVLEDLDFVAVVENIALHNA